MSTDSHRSLLKSGGVVSLGVLTSRILGFLRDILMANLLGTGFAAEAFFVAQRIPNLLRDLVGEGAANAAIVPVLAEYRQKKSREDWQELINMALTGAAILLTVLSVVGMLLAPWIVPLIAPGFARDPQKLQLTSQLTAIMFPYLVFIALTAVQTGILFSLQRVAVPAFGPCLLNVAMISGMLVAHVFELNVVYVLSISVVLGGVAQFLAQWLALRAEGLRWQKPKTFRHEGADKIRRLMLPRLWGSGVYQINIVVDTLCASLSGIVGAGGVAALYYGSRIIQFPLGLFGFALSSVSLASLSKSAAAGDMVQFKSTLRFALRNIVFLLVPCAVILACFASPIIRLVFERGAFGSYSSQVTSQVLFFSAFGLPFYGAARILTSAFYALQDTRGPVVAATICLGLNVVLNLILMYPLKMGGLALASSISSFVNCLILWFNLKKRLSRFP